jgi:hypothetical protein
VGNSVLIQFNREYFIASGATFRKFSQLSKLTDLLQWKLLQDIDGFYKGKQAQADLNNPNRQVKWEMLMDTIFYLMQLPLMLYSI